MLGKRHAEESSLNDDQRFTKRFNLLSLGKPLRYEILNPARACADGRADNGNKSDASGLGSSSYYIPVSPSLKPGGQGNLINKDEDFMAVDETKDRVYVHDLDAELAEIETPDDERPLIFLPDIEQKLSRLPKHLLTGKSSNSDEEAEVKQMVLYSVPKSLTENEGSNSVRKAIVEARQRAREKAAEEARHEDMVRRYDSNSDAVADDVETAHGYGGGYVEEADSDPDAMDLG